MKFKKMCAVLGVCAVVTGMVACGESGNSESAEVEEPAPVVETSDATQQESPQAEEKEEPSKAAAMDTVLVDEDGVKMTLVGVDSEDTLWGYSWKVRIENNTDATLMFATENASINGYMADPLWAETVAPGKKSVTEIGWPETTLEESDIDPSDVEDVEMTLHVYDEDTFEDYFEGDVSVDF